MRKQYGIIRNAMKKLQILMLAGLAVVAAHGAVMDGLAAKVDNEYIMIGDNPAKDIAGGRAAGMKTIYVHPRPGTENTECDAVVRELAGIPEALN